MNKPAIDPAGSKVLIVMSSGPDTPGRCITPFFFARGAANMKADVSMFFTMQGTLLLKKGVAETICAKQGGRPVSTFLKAAMAGGVKFFVCSASLELNDMTPDDLIDEVDNLVGRNFLISEGLDSDLVLNF
jgi:uncharacterized protein